MMVAILDLCKLGIVPGLLGLLICYDTHISETNPFGFITIAISGGLTIILP